MIKYSNNKLIKPEHVEFRVENTLFNEIHKYIVTGRIARTGNLIMDESGNYSYILDSNMKKYLINKIFNEPIYKLDLEAIIGFISVIDHLIIGSRSELITERKVLLQDICHQCIEIARSFKTPKLEIKFHNAFLEYIESGINFSIDSSIVLMFLKIYTELKSQDNNFDTKNNKDFMEKRDVPNDESEDQYNSGINSKTKGFTFIKKLDDITINNILDDHHDQLFEAGFIKRCKKDFKAAYKGNKNFTKIKWEKSFPHLRYYIQKFTLVSSRNKWAIAASIFLKPDGTEFTNRQLLGTKTTKGIIKEDYEIDDIIAELNSTLNT